MVNFKPVVLIGKGWLGSRLCESLQQSGHAVITTRTQSSPDENHVHSNYLFNLNDAEADISWMPVNASLVIAVPPSRIEVDSFRSFLTRVSARSPQQVILISSTGIYRELNQTQSEIADTNSLHAGKLQEIEIATRNQFPHQHVILRMGGLIGYDRNPAKYSRSESVLNNPNGHINMIHADDAVSIIKSCIELNLTEKIYNCCSPQHPTKLIFYSEFCQRFNLPAPLFKESGNKSFKIIDSSKVIQELGLSFQDLYSAAYLPISH